MAAPTKLTDTEIAARLAALPGWTLVAETMGHHPEWSNVWNRVTVDLTTHDAGGISALDFDLAARMNTLAGTRA